MHSLDSGRPPRTRCCCRQEPHGVIDLETAQLRPNRDVAVGDEKGKCRDAHGHIEIEGRSQMAAAAATFETMHAAVSIWVRGLLASFDHQGPSIIIVIIISIGAWRVAAWCVRLCRWVGKRPECEDNIRKLCRARNVLIESGWWGLSLDHRVP